MWLKGHLFAQGVRSLWVYITDFWRPHNFLFHLHCFALSIHPTSNAHFVKRFIFTASTIFGRLLQCTGNSSLPSFIGHECSSFHRIVRRWSSLTKWKVASLLVRVPHIHVVTIIRSMNHASTQWNRFESTWDQCPVVRPFMHFIWMERI